MEQPRLFEANDLHGAKDMSAVSVKKGQLFLLLLE